MRARPLTENPRRANTMPAIAHKASLQTTTVRLPKRLYDAARKAVLPRLSGLQKMFTRRSKDCTGEMTNA